MTRLVVQILCLFWTLASVPVVQAAALNTQSVAFFYGAKPPWNELKAFDTVVVEPDHVADPVAVARDKTALAAYVSVGEVHPTRSYANRIPKTWLRGKNKDWGSLVIDQSQADWPAFFTEAAIAPLWARGYRAFFLDTLDSYHLFAKTPEERKAQEAGLVALVNAVKQRYPEARLIFNRGFEILDRTHAHVDAVVAESLFQRYQAGKSVYSAVPEADRQWLLAQLERVKSEWKLPVVVIDYVAPSNRKLARETARRILDLGFTPWVTTPDLASVGVGSIEVMPRRVLVVHSPVAQEFELAELPPVRLASLPLNYMGYVPEFVDTDHLPDFPLAGRYAGVLVWLTALVDEENLQPLRDWVLTQTKDSVPVALMAPSTGLFDAAVSRALGIQIGNVPAVSAPIRILQQDALMGFERTVRPLEDDFFPISVQGAKPLLTLQQGAATQVAAALTPWGGYVTGAHGVVTLPGDADERWVINPFEFFRQALRLPDMPMADVSTESGRRMLMVHMDGDGFVSRAELPHFPLAGEVVRDRVVRKYAVPMTISVIEAEISPTGLYPGLSALAEKTAREIFSAPHVAIASHSYSHPFVWHKVGDASVAGDDVAYNLRIPGYQFDLRREVEGSVRYIESRLAPPGKKVEVFLWTGDCIPGSDALQLTDSLGLLNMNGGDTVATRSSPTVTQVAGLGLQRKAGFQVHAPNQNENVYTNEWLGPFYGFERVIETYEFTEKPRRLKPIDIYFHTYIATKRAGLQSLDKVFAYALAQETTPVHVSAYARKVLDFNQMVIAKTATGWRVRGDGQLRTLRMPSVMGVPDLQASTGVAGYRDGVDGTYLHVVGEDIHIRLKPSQPAGLRLVSANATIDSFTASANGARWVLQGNVPLRFALAHVRDCEVSANGKTITAARSDADTSYYELNAHAAGPLEAICRN